MPKTIIKIKTWRCGKCGYSQDFEPTQENMNVYFNEDKKFQLSDILANECPSCRLRGLVSSLSRETDDSKKITISIIGEEDLDKIVKVVERSPDGEPTKTRPLTVEEKTRAVVKINEDIVKYKAMEG